MQRRIHNDETFREMWRQGRRLEDIAEVYGVSKPAVSKAARRYGYAPRRETPAARPEADAAAPNGTMIAPAPVVPGGPFWTRARDAQVRATEGRHREISRLAAALGVPIRNIQARWQKIRGRG